MPQIERRAEATWQGELVKGQGVVHFNSGAVDDLPVTWASRTERSDGKTSPEEMIAAAHASCYAMAFSHTLSTAGYVPERVTVEAVCILEAVSGGFKITTSKLTARGKVPGLDATGFQQLAEKAEQGCPVSNALRNNLNIELKAELEA